MIRTRVLPLLLLAVLATLVACGGGYVEEARTAYSQAQWQRAVEYYEVAGVEDLNREDRLWLAIARLRSGEVETARESLTALARKEDAVGGKALVALASSVRELDGAEEERAALGARLEPMRGNLHATRALAELAWGAWRLERRALLSEFAARASDRGAERVVAIVFPWFAPGGRSLEKHFEIHRDRLETILGPLEQEEFLGRLTATRAVLRRTAAALEAVTALDPDEVENRFRRMELAHEVSDHATVREVGGALLAVDRDHPRDLEAERLFPILRRGGLRLMLVSALQNDAADEGLALADRWLPEFGEESRRALMPQVSSLLLAAEKWERLAEHAGAWVAEDPENVTAAFHYGAALAATGRPAEALPYLERAVAANSRSAPELKWLGRAQLAAGQASDARLTLARARETGSWDPEVWTLLADAEIALGRPERAIEVLVTAQMEHFPAYRDPRREAINARLLALWADRDGEGLEPETAREILRRERQNPYALLALVDDAIEEDPQEARVYLQRLENIYPDFGPIALRRARLALSSGDATAAREHIAALDEASEGSVAERERVALGIRTRLAEARPAAALEVSRGAVSRWPDNADLFALHLESLLAAEKIEEAAGLAAALPAEMRGRPAVLRTAAEILLAHGEATRAVATLAEVDRLEALDETELTRAGRLALRHGDAASREHFAERLRAEGLRRPAGDLLLTARLLWRASAREEAIDFLGAAAAALGPGADRVAVRSLLVRYLDFGGRHLEALEALEDLRVRDDREVARRLLVDLALRHGAVEVALETAERVDDPELLEVVKEKGEPRPDLGLLIPADAERNLLAAIEANDRGTIARIVDELLRARPYDPELLVALRLHLDTVETVAWKARIERALRLLAPSRVAAEGAAGR